MTLIGGEIAQLHSLNASFHRHAATVDGLRRELRGLLDGNCWKGGAAQHLRADWAAVYEPALAELSAALQQAALHVRDQADLFEQAAG